MAMNTVQLANWQERMGLALVALEEADPEDNVSETADVDELAIEFKSSHIEQTFQLAAETGTQPRVQAVSPNELDVGIELDADITVQFSKLMDHASLIASTFLYSQGNPSFEYGTGGAYTAFTSVSLEDTEQGKTIATLTKAGGLVAGKGYRLRVLVAAVDTSGRPITQQFDMVDTFNTVPA